MSLCKCLCMIAVDSKSFEVIFARSKFRITLSKTFFEVKAMVLLPLIVGYALAERTFQQIRKKNRHLPVLKTLRYLYTMNRPSFNDNLELYLLSYGNFLSMFIQFFYLLF